MTIYIDGYPKEVEYLASYGDQILVIEPKTNKGYSISKYTYQYQSKQTNTYIQTRLSL